ncbi:undecaprenyldiphospho-muramoylpentapeptide beta-N-acetylglucosaminyltransferase [Paremcibacter congregatus]|uniref:undecaprenyldiphospho-muramoylpentapeptide beta-N-acetylglucosaminyltransferase n=1 Tax=Paremcibacter congregatus TaxID=2043170 RepID=UPI003A92258B
MKRRRTSHIVLAAGGTGGHVFPASALKDELISRGHQVSLVTDVRGYGYKDHFNGAKIYKINSTSFAGRGLFGKILALPKIILSVLQARSLLKTMPQRPGVVVGFGGYPSFPAIRAAASLGIPTCLHEQNAVLGRVNRLMAKSVDAVALSFEKTRKAEFEKYEHVVVTGNPVRREVVELGDKFYPDIGEDRIFRILVIGGSQGASIFGEVVPQAISTLPRALQRRLQITQQCRAEDIDRVRAIYAETKIAVELSTFIPNIPECLEWAHLVIGRAGASTIAELTAAGRAGILVPYPHATDNHQIENAREMVINGGAWLFNQKEFNAAELAKLLQRLAKRPRDVWRASEDARKVGKPYATKDLADLVERLALVKGSWKSIKTHDEDPAVLTVKVVPVPDPLSDAVADEPFAAQEDKEVVKPPIPNPLKVLR